VCVCVCVCVCLCVCKWDLHAAPVTSAAAPVSYSDVPVVFQWCYSGVTVVLQWCYSDATVRETHQTNWTAACASTHVNACKLTTNLVNACERMSKLKNIGQNTSTHSVHAKGRTEKCDENVPQVVPKIPRQVKHAEQHMTHVRVESQGKLKHWKS
jgi:hypothetical protein